jgi:hypothetical protein
MINIIRVVKSRRTRWSDHVAHMGDTINTYKILVGKSEEKTPFERYSRKWEDNIKMDLKNK